MVGVQNRVDSIGPAEQNILLHVGFVAGLIRFQIHFVGNVDPRLPEFDRAGFDVIQIPLAKLGQASSLGRIGPRLASQLLKSRFMPYLKLTEQFSSLPLA